jgi:ubiquinone/menaquinone biosynthesis C-methylase UbiE
MNDVIRHYDKLIEENNDPVHDPEPLRNYMDKWDGQAFIDELQLFSDKRVLEIGVGTGRLAVKIVPLCGSFTGIDISPKTIERAKENLSVYTNIALHCGDFITYNFDGQYDVIYSSLTFMHIANKQTAISKVAQLLKSNGIFVLSIDKNQSEYIDMGDRKIQIYPDEKNIISEYIKSAGLQLKKQIETEFAFIFKGIKQP